MLRVPPKNLRLWVGPFGDPERFRRSGNQTVSQLKKLCGLENDSRVLDIGCGCGRVALSLTNYLDKGHYDGFDVARPLVSWCSQNITPKVPNFRFKWVNVFNGGWNPDGKLKASEFRFPYPSATFDLAWATSVFTHMLPKDTGHFLAEIGRVLKPGGGCLLSFFLLNESSRSQISSGKGIVKFPFTLDGCRVRDAAEPEQAIAYDEKAIVAQLRKYRLIPESPVRYGSWPRARSYFFSQDVIVARKRLPRCTSMRTI